MLKGAYEQRWHSALVPFGLGGGLGLRGIDLHILYEELGWGSADIAVSLMLTGLPFSFLAAARKTDLIDEVVKPFAADRKAKLFGCLALSEPENGSDQFGIGTEEFNDLSLCAGFGPIRMETSTFSMGISLPGFQTPPSPAIWWLRSP